MDIPCYKLVSLPDDAFFNLPHHMCSVTLVERYLFPILITDSHHIVSENVDCRYLMLIILTSHIYNYGGTGIKGLLNVQRPTEKC